MSFPIVIHDIGGTKTTIMDCKTLPTVNDLKKSYSKVCGYTPDSINLVFRGKSLIGDVRLDAIPDLKKNSIIITTLKPGAVKNTEDRDLEKPIQQDSHEDIEKMKNEERMLQREENEAARRHELEKMKLQNELELKKLDLQLKFKLELQKTL